MRRRQNEQNITFLDKDSYRVFPSKSGEYLLILLPKTGEMISIHLITLNKLMGYSLMKQSKNKRAA
ncbi:MAG: hypothetical protein HON90_07675 [Halobacteriovoraceae bacterium]|jgi:hypothetical protein|nr:hypothetical protein [Halobacteriovoraceae bacterium]